ncbi:hypothetical protein HAX54_014450 [Datura stramonium]|uniref:Uncharacterized protein n=1 Tax=Datura stramonium TaxID=4076 RepID=A0ABS8RM34_DATST|nr:hypothetical protein [Datura stramonium]
MPRLQTNIPDLQHNPDQIQRDSEFLCPAFNINNNFAKEESSIQQQLYCPQLQVQSFYLSIDNPFNNSFVSNLEPPSVDLPSELENSDFNQVYFDNQNLEPSSVDLRSEHENSEFNQVYSDNQYDDPILSKTISDNTHKALRWKLLSFILLETILFRLT